MSAADYRKCDNCGCKTFYDASLNYKGVSEDNEAVRGFDYHLERVGDWAVLCVDCAKTLKCVVVEIATECVWKHTGKDERWETTCGNFVSGGNFIRHGGMTFCCFCGNKLSVLKDEK